jgi:hypothetical protein
VLERLIHHCHINVTGNDRYRFKYSEAVRRRGKLVKTKFIGHNLAYSGGSILEANPGSLLIKRKSRGYVVPATTAGRYWAIQQAHQRPGIILKSSRPE